MLVPIPEWERMIAVRQFHDDHCHDPGFKAWFAQAKLLSALPPIMQLLRLDLLSRAAPRPETVDAAAFDPAQPSSMPAVPASPPQLPLQPMTPQAMTDTLAAALSAEAGRYPSAIGRRARPLLGRLDRLGF